MLQACYCVWQTHLLPGGIVQELQKLGNEPRCPGVGQGLHRNDVGIFKVSTTRPGGHLPNMSIHIGWEQHGPSLTYYRRPWVLSSWSVRILTRTSDSSITQGSLNAIQSVNTLSVHDSSLHSHTWLPPDHVQGVHCVPPGVQ